MIEITYADALAGLTAIVAEKGEDFVYAPRMVHDDTAERCLYVYEGQPDCIVGRYLASKGVSLSRLIAADSTMFGVPAGSLLAGLEEEGIALASAAAERLLIEIQSRQDRGYTWGEALRSST